MEKNNSEQQWKLEPSKYNFHTSTSLIATLFTYSGSEIYAVAYPLRITMVTQGEHKYGKQVMYLTVG